ncbi:fimbrial protein [Pseudomonas gingeri]|uniref:fimbrial protein n=1 Tax=Pseudomonas gingeri TaxID=117681 RepID=UPI001C42F7EC|nr:fimbrial protein [Pseudomonas gingeri]
MALLNMRSLSFFMLTTSMFLPLWVLADCQYIQGAGGGDFRSFGGPASITVNRNDPVGKVLFQQRLMTSGARTHIRCTAGSYTYQRGLTHAAAPVAGFSNVFTTGVPGIGIRFRFLDGSPNFSQSRTYSRTTDLGISAADYVEVEIIKTHDNVSPGTIQAQQAYQHIFGSSGYGYNFVVGNYYTATKVIVAASPTCDLAAGDVNRTITLDPVRISNFTGVSTGLRHFDLTANCSNTSNVTFRFTGTPASGNSALFANTGTAGGVALWLHTPNQTVSNNSTRTVAVSGNRGVLRVGAEYHKTTGALTKGTLVSTVTVNISYN